MPSAPQTVLLVEDNEDNRIVYSTILRHFGYRVMEALNGEEGIATARSEKPDLILMDILDSDHRWVGSHTGAQARPGDTPDSHHRPDCARTGIRSRARDGGRVRRLPRQALRAAGRRGRGPALPGTAVGTGGTSSPAAAAPATTGDPASAAKNTTRNPGGSERGRANGVATAGAGGGLEGSPGKVARGN